MLQFQLLQVQDLKEAAAIERRRRFEEQRKKRIFNARQRKIGADIPTLEKQIQEKKQKSEEEKKLDEIFAEQLKRNTELAEAYERKEKAERRKINQEINQFRQEYQRPEDRREFDLNDPRALQNSYPARINDDDPRLSISSAQKFEGEDITSIQRKKIQIEQTKSYLQQQMKENRAAEDEMKAAEDEYQNALIARDLRAVALENLEKDARKKLNLAMNDFNQSLLLIQKANNDVKKRQELEDNWAEMYNAVTGDFLTENPKSAQSSFGPGKKIAYMAKGMTEEQRAAIRAAQLKQMEENKMRKEELAEEERYWDRYTLTTAAEAIKLHSEMDAKRRELSKNLERYNQSLADEQKAYNEYVNKVLNSNKPTAAYYEQFNTTTR